MKHLETFEAAAQSQGIDPTKLPDVTLLPEALGKATVAAYKLFVISQAAWNGKKIDWNNYSQRKYYPWFDLETYEKKVGSSAGFSDGDCVFVLSLGFACRLAPLLPGLGHGQICG